VKWSGVEWRVGQGCLLPPGQWSFATKNKGQSVQGKVRVSTVKRGTGGRDEEMQFSEVVSSSDDLNQSNPTKLAFACFLLSSSSSFFVVHHCIAHKMEIRAGDLLFAVPKKGRMSDKVNKVCALSLLPLIDLSLST